MALFQFFTKGKVWISFISDPSLSNNACGVLTLSSYLLNKWEAAIILGLFGRKCTIEMAEEEEKDGESEGEGKEREERREEEKALINFSFLPKSSFWSNTKWALESRVQQYLQIDSRESWAKDEEVRNSQDFHRRNF